MNIDELLVLRNNSFMPKKTQKEHGEKNVKSN